MCAVHLSFNSKRDAFIKTELKGVRSAFPPGTEKRFYAAVDWDKAEIVPFRIKRSYDWKRRDYRGASAILSQVSLVESYMNTEIYLTLYLLFIPLLSFSLKINKTVTPTCFPDIYCWSFKTEIYVYVYIQKQHNIPFHKAKQETNIFANFITEQKHKQQQMYIRSQKNRML